jgi:hypothetical protein
VVARSNDHDLPFAVRELLAAKVERLLCKGRVRIQDAEDLRQHLATHFLKRSAGLGQNAAGPVFSKNRHCC